MSIRVRPDSPVPIYEQILTQVVFSVANGDLPTGELLPSVRDLSTELVVNPNTVVRAYQELERLGVITTKRGVGMEVTPDAQKLCRERRKAIVLTRFREALREAASAGLTAEDVTQMVATEWPKLNSSRTGKSL
jgi:GntR family transcriptional regulator